MSNLPAANNLRRMFNHSTRLLFQGMWLLLLWALLGIEPAAAQSQDPDIATYDGWVRETLLAARRGDRIGLEDAAARLIAVTGVRAPDGTRISVDNSWLRTELEQSPPDTIRISTRLGAIADALAQTESAAPADALQRLEAILAAPPYSRTSSSPPPEPQWLRDFFNWLGRVLESILRPIGAMPASTSNAIAWCIGIFGLMLLLGVIGYLVRGLRRSVVSDARTTDDDPEANLTAKTALEQASELARGGDYRTAVRYLYLAALLRLDERNLLRYDRALTNREYLERVRDNPVLREHLTPIVETFDRVWYGHASLDAEAFATYRTQVEAVGRDVTR